MNAAYFLCSAALFASACDGRASSSEDVSILQVRPNEGDRELCAEAKAAVNYFERCEEFFSEQAVADCPYTDKPANTVTPNSAAMVRSNLKYWGEKIETYCKPDGVLGIIQ